MKEAILRKGFEIYTDMNKILEPVQEDFKQYNWLITDYEGGFLDEFLDCGKYIWMAGEEHLDIIHLCIRC